MVIKSRMIRFVDHVIHMRNIYMILVVRKSGGKKDHSEDTGIDGRTILEWILKKRLGGCALDSSASGYGPVAGFCEHGNEN
jgi:hypothetical protein